MKYLLLPVHILNFWFIESVDFFIRTWRNVMSLLEEDLAVGLMLRLLFVPLFHDSSFIGRILSFIFRISRVFIGLFAFTLASIAVFLLVFYWWFLPLIIILAVYFNYPTLAMVSWVILVLGVGLFLMHVSLHPHKTVWNIAKSKDQDYWKASWISQKDLDPQKLLKNHEVKNLILYLEQSLEIFTDLKIADTKAVGAKAFELAKVTEAKYIGPTHFFVAAVVLTPDIESKLLHQNLTPKDFVQTLYFQEKKKNLWRLVWIWDEDFAVHHLKGVNRGWLGVPTPNLDYVSSDLTKEASFGGFPDFVGREATVSEIINILSQDSNRNVSIVAPPGSGKTAMIQYLAKIILKGDAPAALATKRLVVLDATRLLSGMRTQGELADRIKLVFDEVAFAGNIIVVMEEIHNLGIGEAGSGMNLYALLQPYLESSAFQFLATTEPENYTRIIERNGSFARLFTKIELPEATPEETLFIIENKAIDIEWKGKIKVSFLALSKCVELSIRLIHDRVLPDSALTVLSEAQTEAQNGWITTKVIEKTLTNHINIPTIELGNVGKEQLLNLEGEIHRNFIDQVEAVRAVANSLRRSATGLGEKHRPIGSFLFVGPTGVGKTELAKTLAKVYFKGGGAFIRFDMSEYQREDSVNKLIGAPGEEGELTEAIRNKPYSLLLLDEFEKADPKVLTLFLQVLDDGRLTDGRGKTVDFTNTIIIATSNAASLTIAKGLQSKKTLEDLDKEVNEELLEVFKPELVNRFDDVILFKPLDEEDLERIVRIKLVALQLQMKEQGYLIDFSSDLIHQLAKKGFDPVLGARPMRRLIQDTIEAKLSVLILQDHLQKGEPFEINEKILEN
jgi:ATP-dependent Clp protease ATP-binding subunit ClpC